MRAYSADMRGEGVGRGFLRMRWGLGNELDDRNDEESEGGLLY